MPETAGSERDPRVVVVGGGASATLTAVHLLRRTGPVPRLVVIDRHGRHGRGQAYATEDPGHLLNARVATMSGLQTDPGHLLDWARGRGLDVTADDFLPRPLYGRYLRDLLADALRGRPDGQLAERTGTVTALVPEGAGWRVVLADGTTITADAVVLATGNQAPAAWPWAPAGPRYVPDPWAPGALDAIEGDAPVLVAGTGLTAVDLETTLAAGRTVHAVSRHGLLPRTHRTPRPPAARLSAPPEHADLRALLRWARLAVRDNDGEWHGVVDAIRPHVPRVWARLPEPDRRRFLDLAARYWEVHRHRIPPATADRIARLRAAGRLHVLSGRIEDVRADADGLAVRVSGRELRVGWLVNGTGPAAAPGADPLLRSLVAAGYAAPGPLGLGLDADEGGRVRDAVGRPQPRLFTLGPTLRGLRYETTAVPEIRAQAADLAARLAVLGVADATPVPVASA
ncbi:FAD/NAD(P)-binding protein [Actinomadura rayongensis]|uniref:FAD-dependent urate hydroxylase HpyO/Asp monooxygenase CreE-like FAD/NAD(P)-binding domain-containing protein n=1 Tax=Actinomadura rayongensis TaxID=1429076 RepID=A0A6I4WDH7_9ACTN|nr:FAD/NAD(P)-binding protein [Actinomadura rayongensis]MXQ66305.1 hypothetical protein [Actinomadura rayongensis]